MLFEMMCWGAAAYTAACFCYRRLPFNGFIVMAVFIAGFFGR